LASEDVLERVTSMEMCGETENIAIRRLSEEDYSVYYEMNYSRSLFQKLFHDEFMQKIWERANAEDILVYTIIEKQTNEICGFCQLEHVNTSTPELGIDIRDGFMGRGYAQEAIKLLISYAKNHFNVDYFIWKADKENLISCHIVEKLGGQLISEKPSLPENVIEYGKEKGIITSN